MKWIREVKKYPVDRDVRLLRKFLWFPLSIGAECRWLEIATVKQKFHESHLTAGTFYWEDLNFHKKKGYDT